MDVAFLGTGTMGLPMARHIAEAGHTVTAWNRTAEKAAPLAGVDGASVAGSAREAMSGAEVLVTMLPTAEATAEALGDDLPAGTVWWQAGTVGVDGDRTLRALAAKHDVEYVDGPVLGTRQPAEDGELIVMAAGPDGAVDRCLPLFDAVGKKTIRLGEEDGAASRLKLVTNHWIGTLTASIADSVLLAGALEVDPQTFLDAIAGGPLDAGYAQMKGGMMIAGSFGDVSFTLDNAAKDVGLVLDAAHAANLTLVMAPAAHERFAAAQDEGRGDEDMAAVVRGTL